jgi:hypothetical protein
MNNPQFSKEVEVFRARWLLQVRVACAMLLGSDATAINIVLPIDATLEHDALELLSSTAMRIAEEHGLDAEVTVTAMSLAVRVTHPREEPGPTHEPSESETSMQDRQTWLSSAAGIVRKVPAR